MTTTIKRALTRRYSDTDHIVAIVEWNGGSVTIGTANDQRQPVGTHMTALFDRATSDGLTIDHEEF